MDTLAYVHACLAWEEPEEQVATLDFQTFTVPGLLVLFLILTPLFNIHPAIATTLLTQGTSGQATVTPQSDSAQSVNGADEDQTPSIPNTEMACEQSFSSQYIGMGSQGEDVRLIQRQLNNWGFPVKNVDGIFGTETCTAVVQFQNFHRLKPDGIVGPETSQALWTTRTDNIQMLQTQLNNWGFPVKNVDGVFNDDTRAAVIQFQNYHGLEPDGIVGPETSQALWAPQTEAIAQITPSPSPTTTPTTTPTPEPSPVTDSTIVTEPSPTPDSTIATEPSPTPDSTIATEPSPTPDLTTTPIVGENTQSKGNCDAFIDALGRRESGQVEGGYGKENKDTGTLGKYQFGEALLKDLGYYSVDTPYKQESVGQPGQPTKNNWEGTWTKKAENDSNQRIKEGDQGKEVFLNNPEFQDRVIKEALIKNWGTFRQEITELKQNNGSDPNNIEASLSKLDAGEKIKITNLKPTKEDSPKELEITKSGVLAAIHLRGAKGTAEFLLGIKEQAPDEKGTTIEDYLILKDFNTAQQNMEICILE